MSFTGDSCFELKPLDVICHIAAVIELIGFMQKDMIKLRIFEVIAMLTMVRGQLSLFQRLRLMHNTFKQHRQRICGSKRMVLF